MISGTPGRKFCRQLRHQAGQIRWWHQIRLAPDYITPGVDATLAKLHQLKLPTDLTGKRVLDVGCWDGFFSFECERRGAEVVAIDAFHSEGFAFAKAVLGSEVEFHRMSVYDLRPERFGDFDVVLFLGVYYHLRHPLLALERIAAITRGCVLVESEVLPDGQHPYARFCEGAEFAGDPTIWWLPTLGCLMHNIRAAGFPAVNIVSLYGGGHRAVVRGVKAGGTASKASSEDIIIHIRHPSRGQRVSGRVRIRGWAVDRRADEFGEIKAVKLYLDGPAGVGKYLGEAELGGPSHDDAHFLHLGDARGYAAFRFVWDSSSISPGGHGLYVHAEGREHWAHRLVEVVGERLR